MRGPVASEAYGLGQLRHSYAFWTLVTLLAAAFALGGSARDDTMTLMALRPIAAVCLGIGLFGLTSREVARFRVPLIGAGILLVLVVIDLIPLPPSIWMALPGRELAAEAARIGGVADAWQPIAMVPWRAWNTLFALIVPLASLILAIRCTDEQRRLLPAVILSLVLVSLLLASLQVAGGYSPSLDIYSVSSGGTAHGLFANRNHFAVILCCSYPMLVYFATRMRAGDSKIGSIWLWLAAAVGAAGLLMLLLTGSRAGLFLALLSLASLPLLYQSARDGVGAWRRRYLVIAVIVLSLVLLIVLAVYFSRAESIDRLLATDEQGELRFGAWQSIAGTAWLHFPIGSGVGSFVEVFQVGETRDALDFNYLNHAHNDWLELFLEFGLAGALIMAAGVFGWIRSAIRLLSARPDREGDNYLGRVGAIMLLLLGLASLVDYPTRVPSIACVAVIAVVWIVAGTREARTGTKRVVPWSALGVGDKKAGRVGVEGRS